MTRTKNSKNNLIFTLIRYVTQLALQFVLRTVLIYYMGIEYIGLSGLYSNIFSFLNLAELGIGTAIVFSMYKPIAENDYEKIKSLQNLYKKFYLIIALIVLAVGGIITPFLNIFINGGTSVNINIYLLYLLYLFNAFVGYFSAHKKSLLFAYQRYDVENKVKTIIVVGMSLMQILVVVLFRNFYIYVVVNIIFTTLDCVLIHIWANKLYPHINGKSAPLDRQDITKIRKDIAALSLHKIGTAVVGATDNILVSSFLGIVMLGAYSNYALIITSLSSFCMILPTALTGSVGDLIATSSKEYVYTKYKQLNFIFSYIASFCTICLICLLQPFIKFWTGGGKYLLSIASVIVLSLSFYLTRMRACNNMFKECAGLFWQDRWKPIVESLVNLGASIGLVFVFGIDGIFIGTIISTLVMPMWVEPLVLFKHYFKKSVWEYFKYYLRDVVIMSIGTTICYSVVGLIPDGGVALLLAKFAASIILSNVLLIILYLPFDDFKSVIGYIKLKLKKTDESGSQVITQDSVGGKMKVVFVSNYLNHHQLAVSQEFDQRCEYHFIATQAIEKERIALGYKDMNRMYDWVVCSFDSDEEYQKSIKLINEADVVIYGSCPFNMIEGRIKSNKLTFCYSERLFKNKKLIRMFHPKIIKNIYKRCTQYKNKEYYFLAASAYAAGDYNWYGAFKGKAFKWGYFPYIQPFDDDLDNVIDTKSKSNTILWCGRFINWKHPEYAIECAKYLKRNNIGFNLKMIGTGPLLDKIKTLVIKNNLQDSVTILGALPFDQVQSHMKEARLFLFTSDQNEGWGAVLNESMGNACCVIANKKIGSVPYLIKDGQNGLIYSSKKQFLSQVKMAMNDDELVRNTARQAYDTIHKTWNAKTAVINFLQLCETLNNHTSNAILVGPCSNEN